MENILETKKCQNCSENFTITDADQVFYDRLEVPRPTLCPDCRQQRRLAWRNERYMYRRKCDYSGKEIVSMYPPDSPFKIYSSDIWWSDVWDPLQYGREFNFSRTFFEQFRELQLEVPRVALINKQSENSDFTNHAGKNRNCYMSSVVFDSEDIYYSDWIVEHCIDCVDCSYLFTGSQLCYETYYSWGSYKAAFCDFIRNCSEVWFCFDCFNTKNSFMCWNLRNKEYFIRNKQYTKTEYEKEMKKLFPMSSSKLLELRKEYLEIKEKTAIRPAIYSVNTENSFGDLLFETKNCFYAFDSIRVEDCRYIYDAIDMKDSMDLYHVGWGELMYECHAITNGYNNKFCHFTYDDNNTYYGDCVQNSNNTFGCVGLKRKQYCILNKQYTKEEYEELVPKIIEHMKKSGEYGEFFPIQFSPFAYNQSRAQEFYPLTKAKADAKNIRWSEYDPPAPGITKQLDASELPQMIQGVQDAILDTAILCEVTKRPYKIIKPELQFYRKMSLPLPHRHPDQRYLDRMAQRNPRKIFQTHCKKCNAAISSSFSPDKLANVYCQKCYLEAVY